jgi:hypothetical protein
MDKVQVTDRSNTAPSSKPFRDERLVIYLGHLFENIVFIYRNSKDLKVILSHCTSQNIQNFSHSP